MIGRRQLVVAAPLALGLVACRPERLGRTLPLPPGGAGDAHVHLFNAADLAVAGYVNFTRVRKLPDWAEWAVFAIVDILTVVIKPEAVTAAVETDILAGRVADPSITVATFGARVAAREDAVTGGATMKGAPEMTSSELALGYAELRRALGEASNESVGKASDERVGKGVRPSTTQDRARLYAGAAREALAGRGAAPRVASSKAAGLEAAGIGDALRYVRGLYNWAVLMLQRRTLHLERFLANYHDGGAPMRIVNLLVDYDYWLDDGPSKGSDAPDQWAFWAAAAKAYGDRADIRTFAGYCPLRHAIEAEKGGPTRFHAIKAAAKAGTIAGLKLYPPMGFYPSGNREQRDQDYVATDGARGRGLDNWREVAGSKPLGEALQNGLDAAYDWAAEKGVPILAHAGTGSYAGAGFETRAHPRGWTDVIKDRPTLRVCLGHFSFQIEAFIEAMKSDPPDAAIGGWPFEGTEKLIADSGGRQSNVFIDISYIEEILPGRGAAQAAVALQFFKALRRYLLRYDPDCSQLMYGSDWIMLEQETGDADYLGRVAQLMTAAEWPASWQANVLRNNLRRFLGP